MIRIILKIIMWVLIGGFLTNFILRNVSYSFYKGNKQKENVNVIPEKVNYTDTLTGYAYHLDKESDSIILCFGGVILYRIQHRRHFCRELRCPPLPCSRLLRNSGQQREDEPALDAGVGGSSLRLGKRKVSGKKNYYHRTQLWLRHGGLSRIRSRM